MLGYALFLDLNSCVIVHALSPNYHGGCKHLGHCVVMYGYPGGREYTSPFISPFWQPGYRTVSTYHDFVSIWAYWYECFTQTLIIVRLFLILGARIYTCHCYIVWHFSRCRASVLMLLLSTASFPKSRRWYIEDPYEPCVDQKLSNTFDGNHFLTWVLCYLSLSTPCHSA